MPRPTRLVRWSGALSLVTLMSLGATGVAGAAAIKGTVQYVGPAVEAKKLAVTVDQFVCGKEKDAEEISLSPQRGLRNAVVNHQFRDWLDDILRDVPAQCCGHCGEPASAHVAGEPVVMEVGGGA